MRVLLSVDVNIGLERGRNSRILPRESRSTLAHDLAATFSRYDEHPLTRRPSTVFHRRTMALTLHSSLGDIKIELAVRDAPALCENFMALAASGAYDGTLFHRNVRGFLVQGGDPTGTGKGGEAIRGGKLEDEFSSGLKV